MNCSVALVLLLDVSGSMQPAQWDTMREGHAAALRAPAVVRAAEQDGIALAAIQFDTHTHEAMGWRVLRSAADVEAAAQHLATMPRLSMGYTFTGSAVLDGLRALEDAPCGDVQIIDVASDGPANGGTPLTVARDAAHAAGVRVNALLVGGTSADVDKLRDDIVTPGGFAMHASDWNEFTAAIRRKMVLEVGWR
jgi:Ca-activated chloride channel homolog